MTLNDEFETAPVKFLKKYPLNTGDYSFYAPGNKPQIMGEGVTNLYLGKPKPGVTSVGIKNWDFSADVVPFHLEKAPDNSVNLLRDTTGEDATGAYYLPWKSRKVTSMVIPADSDANFFFTASLSGCSVFVRGNATNPTVYHAGCEGKAKYEATDLWQACVRKLGENSPTPRFYGIDKHDYRMKSSRDTGLKRDLSFDEAIFSHNYRGYQKLKIIQSSGCVVGVRDDGGRWDFYLQERIWYQILDLGTHKSQKYWAPVALRRFYPTGAKHVQMIERVEFV